MVGTLFCLFCGCVAAVPPLRAGCPGASTPQQLHPLPFFCTCADDEALGAFQLVSKLEGIIPALETSHALAYLDKLCPTLPDGTRVVVNCSGRGDKDVTVRGRGVRLGGMLLARRHRG